MKKLKKKNAFSVRNLDIFYKTMNRISNPRPINLFLSYVNRRVLIEKRRDFFFRIYGAVGLLS